MKDYRAHRNPHTAACRRCCFLRYLYHRVSANALTTGLESVDNSVEVGQITERCSAVNLVTRHVLGGDLADKEKLNLAYIVHAKARSMGEQTKIKPNSLVALELSDLATFNREISGIFINCVEMQKPGHTEPIKKEAKRSLRDLFRLN